YLKCLNQIDHRDHVPMRLKHVQNAKRDAEGAKDFLKETHVLTVETMAVAVSLSLVKKRAKT
ncbi:40134_t:CDS:1, partial [Gigaspora margarita]